MNWKRVLALCLALMMLVCCLSACSGREKPQDDPDTQQGENSNQNQGDNQSGTTDGTGDGTTDGTTDGTGTGSDDQNQQTPPPYTGPYSPLTGLPIAEELLTRRPVAIMINNLNKAQTVQTGLNDAQLIFETYVEGGITRLMAVYEDIGSVGQIGTVRSARYPFVDLALSLQAVYVHNGEDNTYCGPHIVESGIKDFDLIGGLGKYAFREQNGLAYEHTLYTSGSKLAEGIGVKKWDKALGKERAPFVQFHTESDAQTATDGVCISVTVPFSGSYVTQFKYDSTTQRYVRYFKDTLRKDFKTEENVTVKNVFVLKTDQRKYPDGYHVEVDLDGGDGLYLSNGQLEFIKWSKGAAEDPIVITKADGSTFTANPGNSWICLVDKDRKVTTQTLQS